MGAVTAEPAIWLDPDWLIVVPDGSSVDEWPSRGASGVRVRQPMQQRQPLYRASALAGRPGLEFDGSDDVLAIHDGTARVLTSVSLFAVYRMDPAAQGNAYYPVFFGGRSESPGMYGLEAQNGNVQGGANALDVVNGGGNDARALLQGISQFGATHVVSTVTQGSIHETLVRRNGVDAAVTPTGMNAPIAFPLGLPNGDGFGGIGGAGSPESVGSHVFRGIVAEVIAYDVVLAPHERGAVESISVAGTCPDRRAFRGTSG